MQLSASRIVAPAALAGWSLYSLCLIAGVGSQTARRTLSEVVFLSLAAAALVLALGRARAGWGRQSPAWAVVAVGLVGWFLAEAFEAVHPPGDGPPVPSVVDIGYLLLPLCICVSFLMAAATSARQSPVRLLLDGVIVTGSIFGVFWVAILRQLVAVRQPGMFAFVVALTHPLLDVVVIVVGLLLLASARLPRRRSVFLLWLGIVIMSVSNDVEFQLAWRGQDVGGGLLDIGWASALLAFVLAADQSRLMPDPDHRKAVTPPKPLLWLPYLPVLLATPVAATQWPHTDPVVTATGLVVLVAVLARQFLMVEENRRLLATIAEQAVRDPLTGLANRTLFDDRLAHAVSLCRRDARPLAVLTIDLDHFKLVNDRLGHAAGDQVLVQVARRIDACVRSGDTVARLGGDEFAVIVEDGRERADSVAQQIAESFTKPFVVDDQYLFIGPSVGVAIVDGAGTFEASAETLLKQSDAAMYAAKRRRAEFPLQAATDADSAPVADASLLDRLRVAIDHGELDLLYQPKVSLSTGAIVGFEALVRWPHPTLGVLEPVQFLPLVRSNGLTGGLTDVVLGKALRDAAHWYSIGHRLPVAVNLFAPTFADPHLPKRITQLLGDTGLPAGCLTLEMTEDLMLHDAHAAATIVRSLRESGTRISIDDFGTGYCDLNYLRALPIDEVKLDRQFVVSLFDDPRALIIVRALVDLVHDLGMTCVAEGVEDAATAERLRELRCDVAQGFYYSAPVTFSALLAMLNSPLTEKSCSTGGGPAQP